MLKTTSERKSLLVIFSVFTLIATTTICIVLYAQGYRLKFSRSLPQIQTRGLLSATSDPKSASVYIDNLLSSATDSVIELTPGHYQVRIVKDGYQSWEKTVTISQEIVTQTNTVLFRSTPEIKPVSPDGIEIAKISPNLSQVIYSVASASARPLHHLYQLQLLDSPLSLFTSQIRLLFTPPKLFTDWSQTELEFSPDSKEILLSIKQPYSHYLFPLNQTTSSQNTQDITTQIPSIKKSWQTIVYNDIQSNLSLLPIEFRSIIATDSGFLKPNHDSTKFFYRADYDSLLPIFPTSIPTSPSSPDLQTRQLLAGHYYIYDQTTDTNYHLGPNTDYAQIFWLPDTNYLVYSQTLPSGEVQIFSIDHDLTNRLLLFAGKLDPYILAPFTGGKKILCLATLYSGSKPTLYSLTIR